MLQLAFDWIQIGNPFFQFQKTLISMNIKKAIGFGLLAALVSCDSIVHGAACTQANPQSTIFVGTIPQGYGLLSGPRPQGPSGSQGQGQGRNPSPRPSSPPSSRGKIVSDVAVTSSTGHVHTDRNRAGGHPNGDMSKHRWTSANGEPHESEESVDKDGNHHQVHRWTNLKGLSHETDHWQDDKTGKTHQCHRWIDDEGTTHEAVHVTSQHGDPVSEHFIKDKEGRIRKVDWKKGDHKGKPDEDSSDDERRGKKKRDGKHKHEEDSDDETRRKNREEGKHRHEEKSDDKHSHKRKDDESDTEHRNKHEKEHRHQHDSRRRQERSEKESKSEGSGPIVKPGSIVHSPDCAAGKGKSNLSSHQ